MTFITTRALALTGSCYLLLSVVADVAVAQESTPRAQFMRMSWEAKDSALPDRAEEVLRHHADSGLNAMLYPARWSALGDFSLDGKGRVRMNGLNAQHAPNHPLNTVERFGNFARMAERHGIDLYIIEAFFEIDHAKLVKLGPYQRAYVGGYTRYEPFGRSEAPAPLEEKYWLGQLLEPAKLAARMSLTHPSIKGFMFDAEMYGGGGMMYRNHSSFDDQTYAAVVAEMRHRRDFRIPQDAPLEAAPIDRRFFELEELGLLEAYFQVQEDLAAALARRFREEIDAINPDFVLGFYPYLPCWHSNGWARGLTTQRAPVVLLSAFEYPGVHVPQTLTNVEQVRRLNIPHRFLLGFMPHAGRHTPASLEQNIRRAIDLRDDGIDGYWIFSTGPLTQLDRKRAEPSKASGPKKNGDWWISAPPDQFWAAISRGNQQDSPLDELQLYRPGIQAPAGSKLLTGNRFYPGPREESVQPVVRYSHEPDFPFHLDPKREKPFQPGSVVWKPLGQGKTLAIDVDLGQTMHIDKMFLLAGHHGETYFPVGGTLYVSTSTDGQLFYDLVEIPVESGRKLRMPFGQEDYGYVWQELGLQARYLRLSFRQTDPDVKFPDVDKRYKAFALEELAVWGRKSDG